MSARKRTEGGERSGGAAPPRSSKEMRDLARAAALPAIARLAALSNSDDERVALAATQELLNRAFGKTAAAGDAERRPTAQRLVIKVLRFGTDEQPQGSAGRPQAGRAPARNGGAA